MWGVVVMGILDIVGVFMYVLVLMLCGNDDFFDV